MKEYAYRKTFTLYGKRYQIRANTEKELIKKEMEKRIEIERGELSATSSTKFEHWALNAIDIYKNCTERSRQRDIGLLKNNIFPVIGNMKLKDIRSAHCQKAINGMEGMAKSTLLYTRSLMTWVFNKAIANEMITKNPCIGITIPVAYDKQRRSLTEYEQDIFLRVAKEHPCYTVFLLSYYCGCRPTEARNCMGKDVVNHKGMYMLHIRGTKSANADRFVPIPMELLPLIINTPKNQFIALTEGGKQFDKDHYAKTWTRCFRHMQIAAGGRTYRNKLLPPYPLPMDLVPYCLRHTYATNMVKSTPITIVQILMGHADISTTNIYTHLGIDDIYAYFSTTQNEGCHIGWHTS